MPPARPGERPRLPQKTTSFQRWAERLLDHARTQPLEPELSSWLRPAASTCRCRLAVDRRGGANTMASARRVSVWLSDAGETAALLREVPAAYGTQINDALLAALVLAFARWPAGRCSSTSRGTAARTSSRASTCRARWAGSRPFIPVLLDGGAPPTAGGGACARSRSACARCRGGGSATACCATCAATRRSRSNLRALPRAEVSFNYLGEFDQTLPEGSLFAPAAEEAGPGQSPAQLRTHLLAVSAMVAGGRLRMDWSYSENLHRRASVERLAEAFADRIRDLIGHCRTAEMGYTPSDFPQATLRDEDLENVLAELEEAM